MKNLYGYNIYSRELQEAINDVKFGLEKYNFEYKKLLKQVNKIKDNSPNLRAVLDDEKCTKLSEKDCEMLQKIIDLYLEMRVFEYREMIFFGAKENYFYLKKLRILL